MSRYAPRRYNGGALGEKASVAPLSPLACISVFPQYLLPPANGFFEIIFSISCHFGKMCLKLFNQI